MYEGMALIHESLGQKQQAIAMMEEAVACQQRAIQMDMQDITPINTPQPVIQEQVPSQVPTSPLAYPDKTDTDVRAPLSPFSYPVQSSAPNSRSLFSSAASASPPAPQSGAVDVPEVDKKQDLSLQVSLLAVEGLDDKSHGDQVECKLRILHPDRSPLVVGTLQGTWDASEARATFGSAPFDFKLPSHEVDKGQIESTLWEEADGLNSYCGEVVLNIDRLDALAKEQPRGYLSQEFQFSCKEGWTFQSKKSVTAKLKLQIACSAL